MSGNLAYLIECVTVQEPVGSSHICDSFLQVSTFKVLILGHR